jgi:anti-sigma factor RsiW
MTNAVLTCGQIQERLTAYLDNELSEDAGQEVVQHCAACVSCTEVLDALKALRETTSLWNIGDSDISRRVMTRIEAERNTARRTRTFVEVLLDKGIITAPLIEDATARQQPGENLADTLLRLGLGSGTDVMRARAEAENLPFIDLTRHRAEPSAVATIPGAVAWRLNTLPVRKDGQALYVAMKDPRDKAALEEIRTLSQCSPVLPMLAAPEVLNTALTAAYGPDATEAVAAEPAANDAAQYALLSGLVDELRFLRDEMRAAREEIAGLRAEVSELRRTSNAPTVTVSRYREVPDLMPYAPPSDTPTPLG